METSVASIGSLTVTVADAPVLLGREVVSKEPAAKVSMEKDVTI